MKRFIVVLALALLVGLLSAPPIFPANKTETMLIQLQASVAQLQSDLRDMRSAMDERMGMMRQIVDQQSATVNKLNSAIDQVQRSIQGTVTAQGAKVDTVANNMQALNDSMEDIKARVAKLSEQMTAMRTALETLQTAPPQAPAGTQQPGVAAQPGQQPQAAMQTPPPDPTILYQSALKDYQAGNYELALRGFQDYLKFYPKTDFAGNAQFYVGQTLYAQGKYADAIDAYNVVLDRYEGAKTPDAHFKKGMALLQLKDRTGALAEFRTLVRRFPNSDAAKQAQEQIRLLNTRGAAQPPSSKKPAAKRSRR